MVELLLYDGDDGDDDERRAFCLTSLMGMMSLMTLPSQWHLLLPLRQRASATLAMASLRSLFD